MAAKNEIRDGKANQVIGRIVHIGAVETYGNFSKRPFILRIGPEGSKYFETVTFKLEGDRNLGLLDRYAIEDEVKVLYDLRGRMGNKPDANGNPRTFDSLAVWKIEPAGATTPPAGKEQADDGAAGADGIPF
jgi:hypothetical protein